MPQCVVNHASNFFGAVWYCLEVIILIHSDTIDSLTNKIVNTATFMAEGKTIFNIQYVQIIKIGNDIPRLPDDKWARQGLKNLICVVWWMVLVCRFMMKVMSMSSLSSVTSYIEPSISRKVI